MAGLEHASVILRASWVVPVSSPPIQNGEVVIEGATIAQIRPASNRAPDFDFHDCAILPGLVNAHAHLELAALVGKTTSSDFFEWIRGLVAAKNELTEEQWNRSVALGCATMLLGGVTTVGDNTDTGRTAIGMAKAGLRGVVYQEAFGLGSTMDDQAILNELEAKIDQHRQTIEQEGATNLIEIGASPHALYTVHDSLFRLILHRAQQRNWKLSIHASESPAEMEWSLHARGSFAQLYQSRGLTWPSPSATPIQYLNSIGALTDRTILAHCVHATEQDLDLIARSGAKIAHCPSSNALLSNGIAPMTTAIQRQSTVSIGLDGAVSCPHQDLFAEARLAMNLQRSLHGPNAPTERDWLKSITLNGAKALGLDHVAGSIEPGKAADLSILRLPPAKGPDIEWAILNLATKRDTRSVMINGDWKATDGEIVQEVAGRLNMPGHR